MEKREILYSVGIRHEKTGEKINLEVWAENVDEATYGLHGLIGYRNQYYWTGTSPLYENNDVICRFVKNEED